ncbi:MAG TPA: ribosome silencing factor [Acidimicrobiales bacterium]
MTRQLEESKAVAVAAARAAAAKKGQDTVILDVGPVLAIADLFVITSAANARQARTVAEEVEARVATALARRPLRIEGLDDARWVLMDYGDVIVHILLEDARAYYDLERLWADAAVVAWDDVARAVAGE